MAQLTGYIFSAPILEDSESVDKYFKVPSVVSIRTVPNGAPWKLLRFESPVSLLGEEGPESGPPYLYDVWMRRSDHILLMAQDADVVDAFVKKHLQGHGRRLRNTQVRVADLVTHLVKNVDAYALTHVSARLNAFGESLRSASFWGDDIANAQLFRDNVGMLTAQQCGLRPFEDGREALRIAADGRITFRFERRRTVEPILGYLHSNNYLVD